MSHLETRLKENNSYDKAEIHALQIAIKSIKKVIAIEQMLKPIKGNSKIAKEVMSRLINIDIAEETVIGVAK